jgi:RNA polymerase sigma factor (TIGR02999 family)
VDAQPPSSSDPTLLMNAAADGDRDSADQLLVLVYGQLRQTAQRQLANEPAGHTLNATALVHEAYLRLIGPREVSWANRAHFYAAAAESMRRIAIDHARARKVRSLDSQPVREAALRIAGVESISENPDGFLALDAALARLESVDAEAAAVVRLRFFAGLDIAQTALALGQSERTVKRRWAFARGWLRRQLESGGE